MTRIPGIVVLGVLTAACEMQGRVPAGAEGYRCNLSVIGQSGSTGGFRVHRYVDRDGRECAYYDTTLLFPTNALSLSGEPRGVAVLDMTDPSKPVRTATLITPAMQTPHESVNISVQRGLRRGVYTVRLIARSGEEQVAAVVAARH